jgi:hypothetical protein
MKIKFIPISLFILLISCQPSVSEIEAQIKKDAANAAQYSADSATISQMEEQAKPATDSANAAAASENHVNYDTPDSGGVGN